MFKERETSPFSAFGIEMGEKERECENYENCGRDCENCESVVADRGLEQPFHFPRLRYRFNTLQKI